MTQRKQYIYILQTRAGKMAWQVTFMKKYHVTLYAARSNQVPRADCYKGSVNLHVQRNLKSVVESIKDEDYSLF